jgi:hypothetical protein
MKPMFQVNLVVDGEVIDAGHTTNCKHAIRGGYTTIAGIPQAEVCIRRNGEFVFWLHTNFRGEIDEIESHFRRDSVVLSMNPQLGTLAGVREHAETEVEMTAPILRPEPTTEQEPKPPDQIADAWAAVLIDICQ